MSKPKKKVILILDNIRSAYNVGSIFRTADAAGVTKIYITGITPAPVDRFNCVRKDIAKVALGAEQSVPWEYAVNTATLIRELKKEGCFTLALEQTKSSIDYTKVKLKAKNALILGNEVGGISQAVLRECDLACEIPMRGEKESLNVAVAAGIALFRFR